MPTLTKRTHTFRTSVTVEEVEQLLLEWPVEGNGHAETALGIDECRHIEPGAGLRLANAMPRWASGRLLVSVAPNSAVDGSDWFRLFRRSGLGWGMAAHATAVTAGGRDIADELRAYYERTSCDHAGSCMMFRGIESGARVPTQDRFVSPMLQAMREYTRLSHETILGSDRRSLARLAHEAVTNVIDHACSSPLHAQAEKLSYLSVRWYKTVSAKSDTLGGLRSFIESHRTNLDPNEQIAGWIEIVIGGDGVGMAARQAEVDEAVITPAL